jgi:hypothetical protein
MAESQEGVAFALLQSIANAESKALSPDGGGEKPTKKWVLDTYADCLRTVKTGKVPDGQPETMHLGG